jgi:glycosyltransferase involved in cell wall biosynthesis
VSESNPGSIFDVLASELRNSNQLETRLFHLLILRSNSVNSKNIETLKDLFRTFEGIDLRVLTNVSGILSQSVEAPRESEILEKFRSLQENITFLAWDQRVIGNPEFTDTQFLPEAKISRSRDYFPTKATIGFYGKLTSERGLFELLVSVFLNPKLKFRIIGYGFNRKYIFRSRKFVSLKRTPLAAAWSLGINYFVTLALKFKRVSFEQKYFQDEEDMAREFQKCSAVFFSCAHSPYSSGLVYQSLASGVPVVWSDGDSAMSFVLRRQFPSGQIRGEELFRVGGLTKFVSALERVQTRVIFQTKDFDEVLSHCSCE